MAVIVRVPGAIKNLANGLDVTAGAVTTTGKPGSTLRLLTRLSVTPFSAGRFSPRRAWSVEAKDNQFLKLERYDRFL